MSALSEPAATPAAAPSPAAPSPAAPSPAAPSPAAPSSPLAVGWRAQALAALAAGRVAEAHEWLRQALAEATELEWLNDLAVLSHQLDRAEDADALLRAALAIDPQREDAAENLAALGTEAAFALRSSQATTSESAFALRSSQATSSESAFALRSSQATSSESAFALRSSQATTSGRRHSDAAWRRSHTLGGPDPGMYERAFPGMPRPDIIGEHTSRYAYALSLVGGRHVLDLGCGTGYGSEMLSWSAASVRGFDLWRPAADEHPSWPGVRELHYGHDLCKDPLPRADTAVMFEVIEHLPDAPRALAIAFGAVGEIVGSFPNPVYHGSWMNQYHVNDWSLGRFEQELRDAARASGRFAGIELTHHHQAVRSPLLTPGRDPESSYWIVHARGVAG